MLVFRGKYLGRVRDMCALFPTKRNSELGSVYLFKATILPQRAAVCGFASAAEVDSGYF